MPEPKLHKKLTCVMLVHSSQTTFHRKIIYKLVWIYIWAEAVTQRCSVKKVFLEYRKTHRKTPVPESQVCNFIQKETLVQVFFCEFCEISKNNFPYRTLPVVASVWANIA